jgi:hypothetical protein
MAHNNSQNQFLSPLSHAYRSNLLQSLLLTKYQTTKILKNKLIRKNAEFIVTSIVAQNFFMLYQKYLYSFCYINLHLVICLILAQARIISIKN